MTANGWLQIFAFFAAVFLVTKPLGVFMARVFDRKNQMDVLQLGLGSKPINSQDFYGFGKAKTP